MHERGVSTVEPAGITGSLEESLRQGARQVQAFITAVQSTPTGRRVGTLPAPVAGLQAPGPRVNAGE